MYLIAGIFILPPLTDFPSKIIKKVISAKAKFLIIIILFFIATASNKPTENSSKISQLNPSPTPSIYVKPTDNPLVISQINLTPTPSIFVKPTETQVIRENIDSTVVKVIDGDTINVQANGQAYTIRLIGIDSPETVDPRKTVQCFGKEASDFAKKNLLNQKVRLESDTSQGDKDKYNRLLRYVFLSDGTLFNKIMLEQGYAQEYTYNTPYKYRDEFIAAQLYAKNNNLGLWSPTACPSLQPSVTFTTAVTKAPSTNSGSWECNCSKLCSQMDGCEEAMYQLNTCGCSARDGDGDGIPCETLCR